MNGSSGVLCAESQHWIEVAESLGQEKFAPRTKMTDEESRFTAETIRTWPTPAFSPSWRPGNSAVAAEKPGLSVCAYHRVLKVARSISELTGEREVAPQHVAEAVQYRQLYRQIPVRASIPRS
ncbi:MAG: hypothetical protein OXL41_02295 [Nitrospinae bacterium]|nr:hypothetical protein [Nitrospinota bacterium]